MSTHIHSLARATHSFAGPTRTAVTAAVVAALVLLGAPAGAVAQQETGEEQVTRQDGEHEVDRGDTLWDLAGTYLSDPFEWPRIYELNREKIEDPHWIYPGQVFLLPDGRRVKVTGVEVRQQGGEDAGADTAMAAGPEEPADRGAFDGSSIFDSNPEQRVSTGELTLRERRPAPLVSESDFYRVSFLAPFQQLRPRGRTTRVIRENPLDLAIPPSVRLHDRVILSTGDMSLSDGDTLQAVKRGRGLGSHGDVIHSLALLEVREVRGDSARARVTAVFGNYHEGDPVIPAEPYTVGRVFSLREADTRMQVRIVGLAVDQTLVATGDLLFLGSGSASGVRMGDEFAVFPEETRDVQAALLDDRLGVVRVIRVREETATARVVDTKDVGLRVGLPARLVRRAADARPTAEASTEGPDRGER